MEAEQEPFDLGDKQNLEMNFKYYDEMYRPGDSDEEHERSPKRADKQVGGNKKKFDVQEDFPAVSKSQEEQPSHHESGEKSSDEEDEDSKSGRAEQLKNQPKERPFSMIKIGDNLISNTHNVGDLPEEVKEVLKKPDVKKVLKGMADENGNVFIEGKDKIYQITYVQVIPAKTDCFEKYKQMELEKLKKTFNLQKLVLI